MATLFIAGCIITDDKGRILLLHRNKGHYNQWEIPGGKIDDGEDPAKTVVREAEEELGVDIEITEKLGDKHCTEEMPHGTFTNHFTWYRAKVVGDAKPRAAEPHVHDDIAYMAIDDLAKMETNISAAARDFTAEVVAGRITI
jgi:8-oxo-dGTP diphosphatase